MATIVTWHEAETGETRLEHPEGVIVVTSVKVDDTADGEISNVHIQYFHSTDKDNEG